MNQLKGNLVYMIDGRIGKFNYEKYSFRCIDDTLTDKYIKTLDGVFSELECGEKCLWAVNSLLSSKIIGDVIRITENKDLTFSPPIFIDLSSYHCDNKGNKSIKEE